MMNTRGGEKRKKETGFFFLFNLCLSPERSLFSLELMMRQRKGEMNNAHFDDSLVFTVTVLL